MNLPDSVADCRLSVLLEQKIGSPERADRRNHIRTDGMGRDAPFTSAIGDGHTSALEVGATHHGGRLSDVQLHGDSGNETNSGKSIDK